MQFRRLGFIRMNKLEVKENRLYIGEKELIFSENIYQFKKDNDKIYILLDIPSKEELSYDDFHNVYCYSMGGTKLWQIGLRPKGDEAVYTMINFDDSFLYANDFLGRRYSVNKNTGEIKSMIITK